MNIHPSILVLFAAISFTCFAGFNSMPLHVSSDTEEIREEQSHNQEDTSGGDTTSDDH